MEQQVYNESIILKLLYFSLSITELGEYHTRGQTVGSRSDSQLGKSLRNALVLFGFRH